MGLRVTYQQSSVGFSRSSPNFHQRDPEVSESLIPLGFEHPSVVHSVVRRLNYFCDGLAEAAANRSSF
jgi:hypothetical protein